jgi:hypothetical protein
MPGENPYAPPVETAEAPDAALAAAAGGLTISEQGWEIVAGMAKWMRIVSGLQYALGALVLVVGLIIGCSLAGIARHGSGRVAAWSMGLMFVYAVLAFLGATWLRRAARYFYEGVVRDHESPLALGFRNLRLYLILYGIFTVLGLVAEVVKAAMVGG